MTNPGTTASNSIPRASAKARGSRLAAVVTAAPGPAPGAESAARHFRRVRRPRAPQPVDEWSADAQRAPAFIAWLERARGGHDSSARAGGGDAARGLARGMSNAARATPRARKRDG